MNLAWLLFKQIVSLLALSALCAVPQQGFFSGVQAADLNNPWWPRQHEVILEGLYLGYENNLLHLSLEDSFLAFPVSAQATIALAGERTGRLITLEQFPRLTPVQIIVDPTGTVRAMRNVPENGLPISGTPLQENGHLATLSPAENYFTLYHYLDGLFLYKLDDPTAAPLFLSNEPLCAWNHAGNRLAYTSPEHIDLLTCELGLCQKQSIPLYPVCSEEQPESGKGTAREAVHKTAGESPRETVRVCTELTWSPNAEHLLVSFLEDYPDVGSNFFQLAVFTPTGQRLAAMSVENLGACCWLTDASVLLMVNPTEKEAGQILLWHWPSGETKTLPLKYDGICSNLCSHPQTKTIAYTISTDFTDRLYVITPSSFFATHSSSRPTAPQPLFTSPFPIRNLQWTRDGDLLYWDEFNNTITKLNLAGKVIGKFAGYLPEKSVATRFLYFEEEPFCDPLPVYLSPHPSNDQTGN